MRSRIFKKGWSRVMPSKVRHDIICDDCSAEYVIEFDEDEIIDEPAYCVFCAFRSDECEELDMHGINFDD
tara:strand:- start:1310 stop:1519 length:210 start_codon:yes stop_codon:yes gene_type:complete